MPCPRCSGLTTTLHRTAQGSWVPWPAAEVVVSRMAQWPTTTGGKCAPQLLPLLELLGEAVSAAPPCRPAASQDRRTTKWAGSASQERLKSARRPGIPAGRGH
mmetsp:Transcript_143633/g.348836  ORF Transcript_143633/g.348836 Transcript_143633/m.348836 type:complete len:103 (+) Transcript_143633:147-455(+)